MGRNTSSRRVLQRLLGSKVGPLDFDEVLEADRLVDTALDQLESEEPSLLGFMQEDPGVSLLLRSTVVSTFDLFAHDTQRGIDFDRTVQRVDSVVFRALCATAMRMVLRDRDVRENNLGGDLSWRISQ